MKLVAEKDEIFGVNTTNWVILYGNIYLWLVVKKSSVSRQKRISNVTEDGEKHSMIWGMFMTVTMESAVFMGKNYLNNYQSIANTTDLTLKQMFDISARLVSEQDEISGLNTIGTKVYVFSDSVLCLGKILEKPNRTVHVNKDWDGSNHL